MAEFLQEEGHRYGTLGLFVFSWSGPNIAAQTGHLLMTAAVVYVAVDMIGYRRWRELGLGVALGTAILIPYAIIQGAWFNAHPGLLEHLFEGDY